MLGEYRYCLRVGRADNFSSIYFKTHFAKDKSLTKNFNCIFQSSLISLRLFFCTFAQKYFKYERLSSDKETIFSSLYGWVAEWFKAAVLKTAERESVP